MRGPGVAAGCKTWKASLGGGSSVTKVAGASVKTTMRLAIKFGAFILTAPRFRLTHTTHRIAVLESRTE